MEYRLIRSRRKTLAIHITPEGEVEVRAPLRLPLREAERFLSEKQGWIAAKQEEARLRMEQRKAFTVEPGSLVPLLGKEYPVTAGAKAEFVREAFHVKPGEAAKPQLVALYRQLARDYLTRRTAFWAETVGAAPAAIRITGASTRFGSCSGKNNISYTWKLMLAPPELCDYVVVHELCHLLHHNHSPRFWAEVERVLPDWRQRKEQLRQFGGILLAQDWS